MMPFIDPNLITVPSNRGREDFSDVDEMAQSIKEIGQIHPILVKELPANDNKLVNLELLAGETRLRACVKLGREVWYTTTTTGRIAAETELQKTRIEAMENLRRKDLNPYERDKLIDKINALMKEEYGQSIGGRYSDGEGWSTEKTAKMLGFKSKATVSTATQMVRVAEAVPEIKTAKTASEQRALLMAAVKKEAREELIRRARKRIQSQNGEEHHTISSATGMPTAQKAENIEQWAASKLILGNTEELLKKLPPLSVDVWLTDPPYAVNFKRDDPKINTLIKKASDTLYEDDDKEMFDLLCRCVPLICKASKPKSYIFWFCAFRHWSHFSNLFESHGFDVMNKPIIWVRASLEEQKIYPGACPAPSKWPASNTDCCLFAHRNGFLNKQGRADAIIVPPITGNEKEHSVEKPVELMYQLLELCCVDIVPSFIVDPFVGSGTSLVAAIKINPKNEILGFDQNTQCIEIAKGRLIAERILSK